MTRPDEPSKQAVKAMGESWQQFDHSDYAANYFSSRK